MIGRGTSLFDGESAPLSDITGSQRPNPSGTNPDIGAYENSLGESPYPNQTTGLIVESIGSGTINLNWVSGSETNIDKYIIYMSTLNDFIPTSLDSIGESKTNSYTASGLNNGTRYYFRVAPVNTQGYKGLFSNIVEATPNYNGPVWWISNLGSNSNDGSQSSHH